MSSTVDRVSLIEERFAKAPLRRVPQSTVFVYWLSIAVLFRTAWYCCNMLNDSCSTFRLLDTKSSSGLFSNLFTQRVPTCLKEDTDTQYLIRKLVCLFPGTLPAPLIRFIFADYHPFYPTCSAHKSLQQGITSASSIRVMGWIILPFLIKILVAYVAFLHELCLLPGGRANPSSKTWVFKLLRHSLLGLTTASSFFVTLAFTVDPSETILLYLLLQVSCFAAVGLSVALFFRRIVLIRFGLAAIHVVKIAIILSRGTVLNGGNELTYVLVAEGVLEIYAVLVSEDVVADPLSSALFNLLTTLSMLALYVAIVLVGNAKPSLPEDYATVLFPTEIIGTVTVICIVSGMLGFIMTMLLSPPTYQAFRTTCSGILWSFLQLLMMSASFVKNPYKLSEVYDREHPPLCLTLKPFWQQHPLYMPKRLDLPAIASDELPRTVEIFKDLKSALKDGFRLLCWLDFHFPQADPLAPLKNKVRMRPWDDGTRFYPSLLFQLSPTFPKEAKTLQQTPEPMIEAFKEGNLLGYLCQYGVGNTFLRRATEMETYPFFCERKESEARTENEGVVLDFRHLEPYETKPDYEAYGGVAFFGFQRGTNGPDQLFVKWVITPRTKRKTLFNKYSGDFRRAEEMIVSSLYFETAVGKHLGELHMTYNVLATIMNNAFDCGMNTNFPNAPYNAHPFRLILYPHLYSHNIVVELTVNHLVQVGGSFTQVFALTQESLCDYLTTNFSLFHYAEDERFEQRKRLNERLLSRPIADSPLEVHFPKTVPSAESAPPASVATREVAGADDQEEAPMAVPEAPATQEAEDGGDTENTTTHQEEEENLRGPTQAAALEEESSPHEDEEEEKEEEKEEEDEDEEDEEDDEEEDEEEDKEEEEGEEGGTPIASGAGVPASAVVSGVRPPDQATESTAPVAGANEEDPPSIPANEEETASGSSHPPVAPGNPPSDEATASPAQVSTAQPSLRSPSFNCSLDWELKYRDIFETYASAMMDAIYGTDSAKADAEVAKDSALQNFYQGLLEFIHELPERYNKFQTKFGVARFISDTIFHLTVKHEFYGNTGFFAAVDPRINATQVPKDGGPPAVDEWLSLAFIFIGTAHPHFICLLQDAQNVEKSTYERKLDSIFDDATPVCRTKTGTEDYAALRTSMKRAFWDMQLSLRDLHEEWVHSKGGKRAEADENYMYFRPLPADLPTGPGY